MTKTQLEFLAARLRSGMPKQHQIMQDGYVCAIYDVAEALAQTRKGFDRERFLKDCGVTL